MNEYQKQLVQQSFRRVIPMADQAATLFYDRLFELDPTLRSLFKGDMKQQGLKLMNTLKVAVNALDQMDKIMPVLEELGRNHVEYGVQDSHYEAVGQALIWTLETALGNEFTVDVREAWIETYSLLSGVMMAAACEAAAPLRLPE